MKRIKTNLLFLLLTGLFTRQGKAQGTNGLFDQGASKIKLMIAQIAGYQTYLHEIKTGYDIAGQGLNTFHELKAGTFDLHSAYFSSLEQVNPLVKNNPKVKACMALQQQIMSLFTSELAWQQKQHLMSAKELAYIVAVYQNLLGKSKLDMVELTDIVTPGKLQMTDQQRIERVDYLYTAMIDKAAFASSFTGHCRQMATDRKKAKLDNGQLKRLYGIG